MARARARYLAADEGGDILVAADEARPLRRIDLQVHTEASPCSSMTPDELVETARERGLDAVAITDHDTVEGVRAVRDAAPDDLEVIPGVEITTAQGHLLGIGVDEVPPKGVDVFAAVDMIHDQGGVAVLSHPFDRMREAYDRNLDRYGMAALARRVDAVEGVNSRCVLRLSNDQARAFARMHGMPFTGGSDAHFPMELGRAVTMAPADVPIQDAIREGPLGVEGRGGYFSGHVVTKLRDAAAVLRQEPASESDEQDREGTGEVRSRRRLAP